jgi:hypothetical protein
LKRVRHGLALVENYFSPGGDRSRTLGPPDGIEACDAVTVDRLKAGEIVTTESTTTRAIATPTV